ncbi:MAG: SDR family oxidoreductase [Rhodospirillaceae bacterium]|jgi:NAD(P)-dependent dehydrogenase (short-subunit alcohol dehydrogenase family)|nr:SDR family oxidoreductase [Rhodospirillaceae bacterium]MBT3884028.1 SDR family oxidoreductase [Rhodospirillaceae bacterium]MBT4118612.1 SDR family oxidoreductase [Rhodospirillaceae bacterium]MBT4674643.1 SDR family oxidoreductase [Rhodospirillaceae bacterium]MBT4718440.1 SDR family oxidoreductase [Rhodospirillaceae bacterium]
MATVLVTGSNRGIGLEFARQYAASGWRVIATCRNPDAAAELGAITGDIEVRKLDMMDLGAIDALAGDLDGTAIDVLLLNAGINPQPEAPPSGGTDYVAWADAFRTNTMAPLRAAVAFAEHVTSSEQKVIASISSGNASIERNPGGNYVYRSTKAALNLCMSGLSKEFKDRGTTIIMLSPGWVRTDMGGPNAARSPEESISDMRAIIEGLGPEDNGRFVHYDGTDVPW